MLDGVERPRIAADFIYPPLTTAQKFRALITAAPTYAEGIDESKYQYSATKKVNHAAALLGGVEFTAIRVSNCVTADPYFEQAWNDAMTAGMPIILFANVQGYKSGTEQAEFAMQTAEPFIKACKTKVLLFGDFEEDWMTMSVTARQKLANDYLNGVHAYYETGIYSNVKYWGEMYGNMKPPAWAWLWGAHWTSATTGAFPPSWDLSKLIIWQYGVWDNYSWAKPVPGNVPDIDKDRWMWSGGSVAEFLALPTPPPPPVDELKARVKDLENNAVITSMLLTQTVNRVTALESKVAALEAAPQPSGATFRIGASTANARHYTKKDKAGKPIMEIIEPRVQWKPGETISVEPLVIVATGGERYFLVKLPGNPMLYVRAVDGVLSQ